MSTLNPYISFTNTAREAMSFYKDVFGGELSLMTFGEMGETGEIKDLVMHSQLTTPSGFTLMGADSPSPEHPVTYGDNVTVSLSGSEADELRGYWEKLSEDAEIEVPLEKQMWGDEFGMLKDRFGVKWMVNIASAGQSQEA
ncbi:VOC family protein [Falsarthrobacter nasiphocae]|uniref:PhnB protein n=1 Tax=Falsarthrobacter nasiphocae TaxID=189863 RepID=A0AAE3YGQ0_9MICC|nr:VOC family protein [Falsarthrobacter nasiphocae]MDR6891874.1 PhnB protein [Falsarthrobacter nasiphocae]